VSGASRNAPFGHTAEWIAAKMGELGASQRKPQQRDRWCTALDFELAVPQSAPAGGVDIPGV
jgi:hypothetical protein